MNAVTFRYGRSSQRESAPREWFRGALSGLAAFAGGVGATGAWFMRGVEAKRPS
jgi:alpha-D-ribose 1-methylphosphonate 5-triphosphate synthase subunit PhnG